MIKLCINLPPDRIWKNGKSILCDGKLCGKGKHVSGGKYICPHYNLKVKFPNLVKEWDFEKNEKAPEEYLPKSNKKVWWICEKNPCGCHRWETKICDRTSSQPSGCPFCARFNGRPCKHNNLAVKYPEVAAEFDARKNGKSPEEYLSSSNEIVPWKCRKNPCGCHNWEAVISDRTRNDAPQGCPFCNHGKVCPHNNLAVKYPNLALEFDRERNQKSPEEYASGSEEKVWWKCEKNPCGCHSWQAVINSRTGTHSAGCPFCNLGKACPHNNLAVKHPEISIEFDIERNGNSPEEYTPGSDEKVWWKCVLNSLHKWRTAIYCRTGKDKTGCPFCSQSRLNKGYSKIAIEWLQSIEKEQNISIQYFNQKEGIPEYIIPGVGKVDGFHKATNTVYEFHGDFWHGNPGKFNSEDINPINKKTFGQLYKNTIEKEEKIRAFGYNLIIKWEMDF